MPARPSKPKYRRCLECGVVRPSAHFKPVVRHFRPGGAEARCPACTHVGPRWSFYEAELSPEGEATA